MYIDRHWLTKCVVVSLDGGDELLVSDQIISVNRVIKWNSRLAVMWLEEILSTEVSGANLSNLRRSRIV